MPEDDGFFLKKLVELMSSDERSDEHTEALENMVARADLQLLNKPMVDDGMCYENSTPLMWACSYARDDAVRALLDHGVDVNAVHRSTGATAVVIACCAA